MKPPPQQRVSILDAAARPAARDKGDVEALVRLAQADMAAVDAHIIARMQSPVPVIPKVAR